MIHKVKNDALKYTTSISHAQYLNYFTWNIIFPVAYYKINHLFWWITRWISGCDQNWFVILWIYYQKHMKG